MGAWGIGNFENDDAMDLAGTLQKENIPSRHLFEIISKVAGIANKDDADEGPDAYDSSRCLAAIELLAAAKNRPSSDLPESAIAWLKNNDPLAEIKIGGFLGMGARKISMLALCPAAIRQIKNNSELKELWEESDEYTNWLEVLKDLEKRIS